MTMVNVILRKALGAAAIAGGAALLTAGARYKGSSKINAAEKLGEALLDPARLRVAAECSETDPEIALAACAAYLIDMAYQSASGISGPPLIDPIGSERSVTSPTGVGTASVITTAHEPETRWQFDADLTGLARISGSRRLRSSKFTGPKVSMSTPDTVSIRFDNGYVASIETELEFTTHLLGLPILSRTQVHGSATLSDNRNNVGRLRIEPTGVVTGTITRNMEIVGRFEGSIVEGMRFKQSG